MSKQNEPAPSEGKCTMTVNGITVNVSYARPKSDSDEPENAAKQFWNTFYELACKEQNAHAEDKE
ncbi:MAG: hypothetical protein ACI4K7_07900 [Oscillospiraceae bacterium]